MCTYVCDFDLRLAAQSTVSHVKLQLSSSHKEAETAL